MCNAGATIFALRGIRRATALLIAIGAPQGAASASDVTNAIVVEEIAGATARPSDEVLVVGGRPVGAAGGSFFFSANEIAASRATTLSGLLRAAPGASVQTNSRGETLVYLRGGGERQTAVYFAGAPINVPWDNRLNLDLVPVEALSSVYVSSGPTSVLYAAGAAGGVIELVPGGDEDARLVFRAEVAGGGMAAASATGARRRGRFGLTASLGGGHQEGVTIARSAALDLFQKSASLRTNTDALRRNAFARVSYSAPGGFEASANLLHVESGFGVAPEGRAGTSASSPRFWRYPDQRNTVGVLNARLVTDGGGAIDAAVWGQHFAQTINAFDGPDYRALEATQRDGDRSYGGRIVLTLPAGAFVVRSALTALDASHRQTDQSFGEGPSPVATRGDFHRQTISAGVEVERRVGELTLVVGGGGDFVRSEQSGLGRLSEEFSSWSVTSAADYRVGENYHFGISAARKPRFPTDRELFGEAFGRFQLNPALRPETSTLLEFSARYETQGLRLSARPFASFTDDAIEQEAVIDGGQAIRRRINLAGTRALGVELSGDAAVRQGLTLSGRVAYINLKQTGTDSASLSRIVPERPDLTAFFAADYRDVSGFGARLEARGVGRAFATDADGFAPLPRAIEVNGEASYAIETARGRTLEIYVRADNLGDALVEPQFGLPGAGRLLRGGVRVGLAPPGAN